MRRQNVSTSNEADACEHLEVMDPEMNFLILYSSKICEDLTEVLRIAYSAVFQTEVHGQLGYVKILHYDGRSKSQIISMFDSYIARLHLQTFNVSSTRLGRFQKYFFMSTTYF